MEQRRLQTGARTPRCSPATMATKSVQVQVVSPPYICNRMHVWAGTNYFVACLMLIKSKAQHQDRLEYVDHHDGDDAAPEAATVTCLLELSMLFFSYSWLSSARHVCLWGILENEASGPPGAAPVRYELVGHFVDVNIGLLQRSCVPFVDAVLSDALCWVLALLHLAPPPMERLNAVFVQRLCKVLHCCMLRLPEREQRDVCGRAVLALYRLALGRFRGEFAQPVDAMPVPLVDTALLTTVPGRAGGQGGSAWETLGETRVVRQARSDSCSLPLLVRWTEEGPSKVRAATLPVWWPYYSAYALDVTCWHICSGVGVLTVARPARN